MAETHTEPSIIVRLRLVGQAAEVDRIELTHGANDNGDEAEAWRLAALLLTDAVALAWDMHEQTRTQKETAMLLPELFGPTFPVAVLLTRQPGYRYWDALPYPADADGNYLTGQALSAWWRGHMSARGADLTKPFYLVRDLWEQVQVIVLAQHTGATHGETQGEEEG